MKAFFLTFLHILTVSQAFTIPSLPSVRQVSLVPHRMAEETDTIEKPIIAVEKVEETKQALTSQITEKKDEEKLSETKILMQKVKDAGVAGIISYAAWEVSYRFKCRFISVSSILLFANTRKFFEINDSSVFGQFVSFKAIVQFKQNL